MAIILSRNDVQQLLDMPSTIAILERAFAELAGGGVKLPQRTALPVEQGPGVALFMPAHLPAMGALGAKVVTVFGKNPAERNLPAVLGTIILLDQETGEPQCVMEGGFLTAMRTAGASGVATKYLARPDARVHALFGTGVQARSQAVAVAAVRQLERCLVHSIEPQEKQLLFAKWVEDTTHVPTEVASDAQHAAEECDILTLATSSATPVLDGAWLKAGTHINGIGSHAPGMREIDPLTLQRSKVICDLTSACRAEAGDMILAVESGEWDWAGIHGDLGQIVRGEIAARESEEEITLFKSVGLAVQDMSVAHHVFQQALEKEAGTKFAFL